MKRYRHFLSIAVLGVVLVTFAALVGVTAASPPSFPGPPEQLARGAYEDFKVKSPPDSLVDFDVKAKTPVDVVVRRHNYDPGSHTGWHKHPGPIFITVTRGDLIYYLYDDPTCTPHEVKAGEGFVDDGQGHMIRNESGEAAQDVSVAIAPTGGAFRSELDAPNPNCGF